MSRNVSPKRALCDIPENSSVAKEFRYIVVSGNLFVSRKPLLRRKRPKFWLAFHCFSLLAMAISPGNSLHWSWKIKSRNEEIEFLLCVEYTGYAFLDLAITDSTL